MKEEDVPVLLEGVDAGEVGLVLVVMTEGLANISRLVPFSRLQIDSLKWGFIPDMHNAYTRLNLCHRVVLYIYICNIYIYIIYIYIHI